VTIFKNREKVYLPMVLLGSDKNKNNLASVSAIIYGLAACILLKI